MHFTNLHILHSYFVRHSLCVSLYAFATRERNGIKKEEKRPAKPTEIEDYLCGEALASQPSLCSLACVAEERERAKQTTASVQQKSVESEELVPRTDL